MKHFSSFRKFALNMLAPKRSKFQTSRDGMPIFFTTRGNWAQPPLHPFNGGGEEKESEGIVVVTRS